MPCCRDTPARALRGTPSCRRRGTAGAAATSGVTGMLPVAQVAVDHLPGAGEDHPRNPERARRFHHLVRPDDVVRHQFRDEVVAVVGRRAAREAGVVRRRGEVDDRVRAGRGPAQCVHVGERRRRPIAPAATPGVGRTSNPVTCVPAGDEFRDRRPAEPPGRPGDENALWCCHGDVVLPRRRVTIWHISPTRFRHEPPRIPGRVRDCCNRGLTRPARRSTPEGQTHAPHRRYAPAPLGPRRSSSSRGSTRRRPKARSSATASRRRNTPRPPRG